MNKKALILAALVGAAAAASVLGGFYFWDVKLSPKSRALAIVKDSLIDPYSAVFERVEHYSATGATCGYVNAKNKFGAYTGLEKFVVDGSGELTFIPAAHHSAGASVEDLRKQVENYEKYLKYLSKTELCSNSGAAKIQDQSADQQKSRQSPSIEQKQQEQVISRSTAEDNGGDMEAKDLIARGEQVYKDACIACHRADGIRMGPIKQLSGSAVVMKSNPDELIGIILNGVGDTGMPAWKHLTNTEVAAVITYVANSWSNKTGLVIQPSQVAKARNGSP